MTRIPAKIILGVVFVLIIISIIIVACSRVVISNIHKNKIEEFSTDLPTALKIYVLIYPERHIYSRMLLKQKLKEIADPDAWLFAAYENDQFMPRFVKDFKPSNLIDPVFERISRVYEDGIDPNSFPILAVDKYKEEMAKANADIEERAKIELTAEEKAALLADLDAKNDPSLLKEISNINLLIHCLKPGNENKYPSIVKTWAGIKEADKSRETGAINLEITYALIFSQLINDMGLPGEERISAWQQSKTKMDEVIKGLEPDFIYYEPMKKELARYRKLSKKWHPMTFSTSEGKKFPLGAKSETVLRIQQRLAIEEYYSGPISGIFDVATREALLNYQIHNQIPEDGEFGKNTIESFNKPIELRVRQIKLSLDRMRHSALRRQPNYYLRVNIPQFIAEVFENNTRIAAHKVIVGNRVPKNHTPLLKAYVSQIIWNPPWFPPPRIIKEEYQSLYDEDPEYFDKKGWTYKVSEKTGELLSIMQPPGPSNALGKVKINFPNIFDVYMHDTNMRHLFANTYRTYSHGCIRTHQAVELAKLLLEKDGNPEIEKADKILATNITTPVDLKTKVPIFIEYNTVSIYPQDGKAIFSGDYYEMDKSDLSDFNPI